MDIIKDKNIDGNTLWVSHILKLTNHIAKLGCHPYLLQIHLLSVLYLLYNYNYFLPLLQNISEFECRMWTNNFREFWTFIKNIKENPDKFLSNVSSNKETSTIRKNVWKKDPKKFESLENIVSKQGLAQLHPTTTEDDSDDGYLPPIQPKNVHYSNNRPLNSNHTSTDKLVHANRDEDDLDDGYLPPITIKEKDVPSKPVNTCHIRPNNSTLHKLSSNMTKIPKKVIKKDPLPLPPESPPTTYINTGSLSQQTNSDSEDLLYEDPENSIDKSRYKSNTRFQPTKSNIQNRKLPKVPDEEDSDQGAEYEPIPTLGSIKERPLPPIPNTRNEIGQFFQQLKCYMLKFCSCRWQFFAKWTTKTDLRSESA